MGEGERKKNSQHTFSTKKRILTKANSPKVRIMHCILLGNGEAYRRQLGTITWLLKDPSPWSTTEYSTS